MKIPLFYLPFTIGIIVALLLSSCALTNCNEKDTGVIDAINGILVDIQALTEQNKIIFDAVTKQAYLTSELRNETKQTFDLFQNEIVKIKNDIRNKFPQASIVEQEEQTAISETPFLTLTMEKTEWILGDTLVFTGAAHPSDLVSITIKLPDRTLLQGTALPGEIVNGMYRIEIATNFDHAPGTWTVFAKQGREQSTTLIFKVE